MRSLRITFALVLSLGSIWLAALAAPTSVIACSCAPREPGAPIFSGEETAVLVGTVGQQQGPGRFEFKVERWFKGGEAAVMTVSDGTFVFDDGTTGVNTCGVSLQPGQHVIMSSGLDQGVLQPNNCTPFAAVESQEGQQLVAAAVATFGQGAPPGGVPDPSEQPEPGLDLALIALAAVGLIVALSLGAIVLAVARRGPGAGAAA